MASTSSVRLDKESAAILRQAAGLRKISVSDYVRAVTVSQARREIQNAGQETLTLTADEQHAFWDALNKPATLTPAQRQLGAVMRGEA